MKSTEETSAILPVRDIVLFPQTVINVFVGRPISIKALNLAHQQKKQVILASQKKADIETPDSIEHFYRVATIGRIVNRTELPDGNIKVLIEGQYRIEMEEVSLIEEVFQTRYRILVEKNTDNKNTQLSCRKMLDYLKQYLQLDPKLSQDSFKGVNVNRAGYSADFIVANLPLTVAVKMTVLEELDVTKRCQKVRKLLLNLIEKITVDRQVNQEVKKNLDKTHRNFYLSEKMKVIRKELGEEEKGDEVQQLKKRIQEAPLPEAVRAKADSEYKKISSIPTQSPEFYVILNYIDTLLNLPWEATSETNEDIPQAEKILNQDHYGLEEVKERILEHLAVRKRTKKPSGAILCLVGPPGVGKTSLAESIAKATGRAYVRMALGGLRDEAEIRGHRRTYIGSMPGKILQKMTQSKVKNPLFLLDEIDKMSADFRGNPASALLEVLDPEQNHTFSDHYMEVDYDLSEVMFIATSNSLHQIPEALLDRLEIIELSGYTDTEKTHIAKDYLLPKQKRKNGIKANEMRLTELTVSCLINDYTREAGVRSLERQIAKICRKIVRHSESKKTRTPVVLSKKKIAELLGAPLFHYGEVGTKKQVGQIIGLAWNRVGGDILTIETAIYPGKGKITCTGQLGKVMVESIHTAYSVVKSYHTQLGIDPGLFSERDVHLHIPEGATPKDGPSAGMAIVFAIASSFNATPIRSDIGMTGEITLRGEVLAIGGLKQKLLAAQRSRVKTVFVPSGNAMHLEEFSEDVTKGLKIVTVRQLEEIIPSIFPYLVGRTSELPRVPQSVVQSESNLN